MALIQYATANNGNGTSNAVTATFPNPTGANFIILGFTYKTYPTAPSISSIQDSSGQAYTTQVNNGDGNHYNGYLATSLGQNSGVTSVTVTLSAAVVINMIIAEESGLASTSTMYGPSPVIDGTPAGTFQTPNTGTFSSGSTTTTNPTDVLYGYFQSDYEVTATASGWTTVTQLFNNTDGDTFGLFRKSVSSTGTYAFSGTTSPNFVHAGASIMALIGNVILPVPSGAKQTFVTETLIQY
jgi:hypothetical protein